MNSKYLKKLFAVLLLGFIFAFNAVPVSFAKRCPSRSIDSTTGLLESDAVFKNSCESVSGCKISGDQCISTTGDNYDVNVSTGTVTNNGNCATVGTPIGSKDAPCDKSIISCPSGSTCSYKVTDCPIGSGAGWRCIMSATQPQLPPDVDLRTMISPYQLKVTIPCNTALGTNSQCPAPTNPAGYIARLYQFGLMIVGFVALGAIIYGAALYTLSAGNMASKEEGKSWMLNAIYGILLLLGAYLILYTINPNLVNLKNPDAEPIDLDTFLPPPTQVTDCSQIKPDYSNISQPCGANCKLDATTANGCSKNGSNNTVTENSGASAIPGCLVSQSSGGMFGINTTNNRQQVSSLSSSSGSMECTKCAAGNDLVNGTCVCKTNLVRQPDGTCNASKLVLAPCPTGYDYDTNATCNDCAANYRKDSSGKCVIPIPVKPPMYCSSGYTGPDGKCLP